ncbi:hypothetical protein D3C76_958360 [compost metagenome]
MIQPRIEVAAFAEQVLILVNCVTQRGIGFAVVIAFAVRGVVTPAVINLTIQEGGRFPVVISPHIDVLLHHLMLNLQRPYTVLPIAGQARQGPMRQLDAKLVMPLMVVKLDHINVKPIVVGEAIPDADFRQQTADESQIALTVLHDLFTLGVFARQVEHEVLPFQLMATAQDAFNNLRYRLMLIDPVLLATSEQCQVRFKCDLVAGFIPGAGDTLETRDHAMHCA